MIFVKNWWSLHNNLVPRGIFKPFLSLKKSRFGEDFRTPFDDLYFSTGSCAAAMFYGFVLFMFISFIFIFSDIYIPVCQSFFLLWVSSLSSLSIFYELMFLDSSLCVHVMIFHFSYGYSWTFSFRVKSIVSYLFAES